MVRARAAALAMLAAAAVLAAAAPSRAADYRFEVERNASVVTIRRDGSVDIEYELRFRCLPGGKPIDIVDIGLPNRHYLLDSARAELDGQPLPTIRRSSAVAVGVEIPLPRPIYPGQAATLYCHVNNPHMVYQDRDDDSYAGVEFSPTWYGAGYASGTTDLSVTILFPEGVTGAETRYHRERFDDARTIGGRISFTWRRTASPSQQYMFGVSLPKRYVEVVHRESRLAMLLDRVRRLATPGVIALLALVSLAAVALLLNRANELRKMDYMPPALAMEGNGVRRGLTAVEAAVLLEQPLDRIAAMIIFGLAQKGGLRVRSFEPLAVEAAATAPPDLRPYEKRMLQAMGGGWSGKAPDDEMHSIMTELVSGVNDKLRGYNRRETAEYYRYIVSKAWRDVASAQTPQEKAQRWERNADWTMADEDYGQRMEDTFGREEQMPWRNRWWSDGDYDYRPQPDWATERPPLSLPGREFADRLVSRIERMARGLVPDRQALAQAVTRETNPPSFVPGLKQVLAEIAESRGGGGGGGCACACACASCACACAGGGR
jgi:hypothetical protein